MRGLEAITAGTGEEVERAIQHLKRFTTKGGIKKARVDETNTAPKITALEYPAEAKAAVYKILRRHQMHCTCTLNPTNKLERRHLVKLLLQAAPEVNLRRAAIFEMLFSSAPSTVMAGRWQDVQLQVPRDQRRARITQKRARFAGCDDSSDATEIHKSMEEVKEGRFCHVIELGEYARLCFTIQNDALHRLLDSDPVEHAIDPSPGISLAQILQEYHLEPKMKASLAYILAQSVWNFYDSDWIATPCSSQAIQFMKQYTLASGSEEADIYASKPYSSVCFDDSGVKVSEATSIIGVIHRYPRVRALGVTLVEIGLGHLIESEEANGEESQQVLRTNERWLEAKQYSDMDTPWPGFDFAKYRTAVRNCLDQGIFAKAPFVPTASAEELAERLKERRRIFYDSVVFPLEELIQGTGWKDEIHRLSPLRQQKEPPKQRPCAQVQGSNRERPGWSMC
jgi:hypothetical protein